MLDLNKYSNSDKSRILHTSGYARVGRGMQIGSTGNGQAFQKRLEVTERSRTVEGYRRSAIGSRRGQLKAQQVTPETARVQRRPVLEKPAPVSKDSGVVNSPTSRPTGFKEPPSRGYNPFA